MQITDVTVLNRSDEITSFVAEWSDLYCGSGDSLFQNPTWHQIWWDTIGHEEGWRPHIVVGRAEGRLVAVAPLAVSRAYGLRKLEWAGARVFDYPDILAADGVDVASFWKMIGSAGGYDVARISDVQDGGSSCRALRLLARKLGKGSPVYEIDLAYQSGEHWLSTLSKRTRANHAASIQQIEKVGSLSMHVIKEAANVPDLVALLVQMKDAWAAARGVVSNLSRPGMPEFMTKLALQALEDGTLCLSTLNCGQRTIALHLGFVSSDRFYYYQPTYDSAFAKMSPGRLHLTMLAMWAIDNGYDWFDFMRGDHPYKTALANEARRLNDYMFARGLFGTMASHVHELRQRVRQCVQGAVVPDGRA